MKWPIVVGVRHHSPACAGLVRDLIGRFQPRFVLVEGPVDYNPLISELALDHQLPIALFSSRRGQFRCYTPFCDYSPEWVAIREGFRVGAEVRFVDLPVGHEALEEFPNRYCDDHLEVQSRHARQLGYDDFHALWDALIEQWGEVSEGGPPVWQRLRQYFQGFRQHASARDLCREEHMARCLAWAQARGPTLLVCGGFHAPQIEESWSGYPADWPPSPPPEGVTHLVPYSFRRLDAFEGYAAGMPSPQYYQWCWEEGLEKAARRGLEQVARDLRRLQQTVSSADLIAAWTNTQLLARIRGHQGVLRADLMDGLLGALVKEERDPLSPVLVALSQALSGERRGRLDDRARRPGLVREVEQLLQQHQLTRTHPPRQVVIEPGQEASHILHQMRILGLPGIACLEPDQGKWALAEHPEWEGSLIEAAGLGSTLEEAAVCALQEQLSEGQGASQLAFVLLEAGRAGLLGALSAWVPRLARALGRERDLEELVPALQCLGPLDALGELLQLAVERCLWLLEGLATDHQQGIPCLLVFKQLMIRQRLARPPVLEVMARLSRQAPWQLRGGACGLLWSQSPHPQPPQGLPQAAPVELGEFLLGLFSLAREQVVGHPDLVQQLHQWIVAMDRASYLAVLPSLRLAFQRFSPQERQELALALLPQLGLQHPRGLLRLEFDPRWILEAEGVESWVEEQVLGYGL